MWGLIEGLKLALQLNINHLNVEVYSQDVINLLNNPFTANKLLSPLLFECRQLLMRVPHKLMKHFFKEANQCVDALANKRRQTQSPLTILSSPPENVTSIGMNNVSFAYFPRLLKL